MFMQTTVTFNMSCKENPDIMLGLTKSQLRTIHDALCDADPSRFNCPKFILNPIRNAIRESIKRCPDFSMFTVSEH